MIKEALQYLIGLAPGERVTIDGRQYSTTDLYPVMDPTAKFLELHSLTGLIDYLRMGSDLKILYEVLNLEPGTFVQEEKDKVFIHVLGPGTVYLYGTLDPKWHQRECFLKVSLIDNPFRFGNWYEIEDFIIEMQAKFEIDDTVRLILGYLSRIDDGSSKTIQDDGITQQVMTRSGINSQRDYQGWRLESNTDITRLAMEELPNPVTLKPYRTFSEVNQPESQFVLRLRSATQRESDQGKPKVALFDAGGNLWQIQAIKAIRDWLKEQLPDIAIIA